MRSSVSSNIFRIQTESIKKVGDNLITGMVSHVQNCVLARQQKQAVDSDKLHRVKDERIHMICGLEIIASNRNKWVVPARRQDQKKNTCAQTKMWCKVKSRVLIGLTCKERSLYMHAFNNELISQEEPQPAKIVPNFRTPPCIVFVGSIPITIST